MNAKVIFKHNFNERWPNVNLENDGESAIYYNNNWLYYYTIEYKKNLFYLSIRHRHIESIYSKSIFKTLEDAKEYCLDHHEKLISNLLDSYFISIDLKEMKNENNDELIENKFNEINEL